MKTDAMPRDQIAEIFAYFRDPAHGPEILMLSEKSRYVWQHISAFFYTDQVPRGGAVHELPEKPDAAVGNILVKFKDGTGKTVENYFQGSTMDAILVLHKGSIVYERYKTMSPADRHVWFSCSKTIVATSIALLEHEGKISVVDPVSRYLTELAGSAWDTVTVEQTLDMATGLDSTEHEESDARTNPARGWYRWAESIGVFAPVAGFDATTTDVLRAMKRTKPAHTVFEYNSINTYVLQQIVQNVSGKSLVEICSERIWRKIGAEHDGYYGLDKHGDALGFGFMNSSLRDIGRYGMAFTPSGSRLPGAPIIPAAVIEKFKTGLRPEMYAKGTMGAPFQEAFFSVPNLANRYQWDVVTPDGDLLKAGLGGQGLWISGRNDAVVVFFSTGKFADEQTGAWVARSITESFGKG